MGYDFKRSAGDSRRRPGGSLTADELAGCRCRPVIRPDCDTLAAHTAAPAGRLDVADDQPGKRAATSPRRGVEPAHRQLGRGAQAPRFVLRCGLWLDPRRRTDGRA
jgi:hypothetical protein